MGKADDICALEIQIGIPAPGQRRVLMRAEIEIGMDLPMPPDEKQRRLVLRPSVSLEASCAALGDILERAEPMPFAHWAACWGKA